MTCRYLAKDIDIMAPETGGSFTPEAVSNSVCQLGREPNTMGWITKCEKTSESGTCWFWVSVHGSETPDTEFITRR